MGLFGGVVFFCVWFFCGVLGLVFFQKFKFSCVRAMLREWYEAVLARGLLAACAPGAAG